MDFKAAQHIENIKIEVPRPSFTKTVGALWQPSMPRPGIVSLNEDHSTIDQTATVLQRREEKLRP